MRKRQSFGGEGGLKPRKMPEEQQEVSKKEVEIQWGSIMRKTTKMSGQWMDGRTGSAVG
jgi:hypothetical protein